MISIGFSEVKNKFSEICERAVSEHETFLVTRGGKALVKIEPVESSKSNGTSVWDLRLAYEKKHGPLTEDFELSATEKQSWRNPLDD